MADAAKHLSSINGGFKVITDLKSLFSLFKTRRSIAFAYGFMFVFVAFTVYLAFNPSSSSSSSLSFSNIFSVSSINSSSSSSSSSNGSQFSTVFSYFFPNISSSSSSSPEQVRVQPQNLVNSSRSNNTTTVNDQPPNVNHTQSLDFSSRQNQVLHANQTSIVNKQPSTVQNNTQSSQPSNKDHVLKPNQTSSAVPSTPKTPLLPNQTRTESSTPPLRSNQTITTTKSSSPTPPVKPKPPVSNYTASSPKQQGNGGASEVVAVKQGIDSVMESLMNCDLFDGEWVEDHSYPLYKPGSCSFIDEQFNCLLNGRPDKLFQQFKWKPKGCTLPRYSPQS